MLKNWNDMVKSSDTVYFLGDLAYGTGSRPTDYWMEQVKGKIVFIKGSHDRSKTIPFLDHYVLEYGKYKFFLVHRYERNAFHWQGWVIHGHVHNKQPFMSKEQKLINISVDVTDWKPVNIDDIIKSIERKV